MTRYEEIIQSADDLLEKYNTRNPTVLADELSVKVLYRNFNEQKGIFTVVEDVPFVFINNNLEDEVLNMVLIHELAHFLLHLDELGTSPLLVDGDIFDKNNNRQEYEANLFASQILLPEDEILSLVYGGYTQFEIALSLRVDVNLVALKIETLIHQGHNLRKLDYKRNFM